MSRSGLIRKASLIGRTPQGRMGVWCIIVAYCLHVLQSPDCSADSGPRPRQRRSFIAIRCSTAATYCATAAFACPGADVGPGIRTASAYALLLILGAELPCESYLSGELVELGCGLHCHPLRRRDRLSRAARDINLCLKLWQLSSAGLYSLSHPPNEPKQPNTAPMILPDEESPARVAGALPDLARRRPVGDEPDAVAGAAEQRLRACARGPPCATPPPRRRAPGGVAELPGCPRACGRTHKKGAGRGAAPSVRPVSTLLAVGAAALAARIAAAARWGQGRRLAE
eukprot:scaffold706_cov418-Prasinococcus_capsulatus_cf.AAC.63